MSDASNGALQRSNCVHSQTRVEILPRGQPHYGSVVCVQCGKHLCWEPFPQNASRKQQNAIYIRQLLGSGRLTDWERGYCEGIRHNHRLAPHQQRLLDGLVAKYKQKGNVSYNNARRNGAPLYECAV